MLDYVVTILWLIGRELTVLGKIGSFKRLFCICSFGRARIGLRVVG